MRDQRKSKKRKLNVHWDECVESKKKSIKMRNNRKGLVYKSIINFKECVSV